MTKEDSRILSAFASSVRNRYPEARVWAFGSRVTGSYTQESDLDVCVVVNQLDDAIDKSIMDIAWELGFENDMLISTVTYAKDRFERGPCSESALVKTVLERGISA
jgi:predicted nucleotidyltransferase